MLAREALGLISFWQDAAANYLDEREQQTADGSKRLLSVTPLSLLAGTGQQKP